MNMDELIIKDEMNSDSNDLPEASTSRQFNKNVRKNSEHSTIVRKKFKLIPNEVNRTNGDGAKEIFTNGKNEEKKDTGNSNFNEEVIGLLKAILEKQTTLEIRMTNLEKAFNENTSVVLAQNQQLEESEALRQKLCKSFSCMTGTVEEILEEEICGIFPLTTIEAVDEIEDRLQNKDFAQAMSTYLYKMKGNPDKIDIVFRRIFSDDLLSNYNWDGRWGKISFAKLELINTILFDVFKEEGHVNLVQSMKRCINLSHNRDKQKKYLNKVRNK